MDGWMGYMKVKRTYPFTILQQQSLIVTAHNLWLLWPVTAVSLQLQGRGVLDFS